MISYQQDTNWTLKTEWPSEKEYPGYPAKTRKGEPENAAGKGQEHHAERTAPNIWNYDDTQNRNYQFLKIKFTMWYNFFNGLQQKTGSTTSAFL